MIKKDIQPIILNFPVTKYYLEYLNKEFINAYYDNISKLKDKYSVTFVDLNKNDVFYDTDFVDFDHLSDSGAKKVCDLLNKIIEKKY